MLRELLVGCRQEFRVCVRSEMTYVWHVLHQCCVGVVSDTPQVQHVHCHVAGAAWWSHPSRW